MTDQIVEIITKVLNNINEAFEDARLVNIENEEKHIVFVIEILDEIDEEEIWLLNNKDIEKLSKGISLDAWEIVYKEGRILLYIYVKK